MQPMNCCNPDSLRWRTAWVLVETWKEKSSVCFHVKHTEVPWLHCLCVCVCVFSPHSEMQQRDGEGSATCYLWRWHVPLQSRNTAWQTRKRCNFTFTKHSGNFLTAPGNTSLPLPSTNMSLRCIHTVITFTRKWWSILRATVRTLVAGLRKVLANLILSKQCRGLFVCLFLNWTRANCILSGIL